jgi:hypothetical protein
MLQPSADRALRDGEGPGAVGGSIRGPESEAATMISWDNRRLGPGVDWWGPCRRTAAEKGAGTPFGTATTPILARSSIRTNRRIAARTALGRSALQETDLQALRPKHLALCWS